MSDFEHSTDIAHFAQPRSKQITKSVQIDIVYLSDDRILLMEIPSETYILPIFQFLEGQHVGHYKIFDFSGRFHWPTEKDPEVQYFIDSTIDTLCQAAQGLLLFLTESRSNVAVLTDFSKQGAACLSIILQYFFQTGQSLNDIQNTLRSLIPSKMSFPSNNQLYILNYFSILRENSPSSLNFHSLRLNKLVIAGVQNIKFKCLITQIGVETKDVCLTSEFQAENGSVITNLPNVLVQNNVLVQLLSISSGELLFQAMFHTAFVSGDSVIFRNMDIDFSNLFHSPITMHIFFSYEKKDIQFRWMKFIDHLRSMGPIPQISLKVSNKSTSAVITVSEKESEKAENRVRIFGAPLEEACRLSPSPDTKFIPSIISFCVEYLLVSGLDSEGIFIAPTSQKSIDNLKEKFEGRDWTSIATALTESDPTTVAAVLKLYLKMLPDKLIPSDSFDTFVSICDAFRDNKQKMVEAFRNFYNSLEIYNKATLMRLFQLLSHIANSKRSNANPKNLAMTFVPLLLSKNDQPQNKWQQRTERHIDVNLFPKLTDGVATLVSYFDQIFQIKMPNKPQQKDTKPPDPSSQLHVPENKTESFFGRFSRRISGIFGGDKPKGEKPKVEKKAKLFGGSLVDGCKLFPSSNDENCIPSIITMCIDHLRNHDGLRTEGIFRVPGASHLIDELQNAFETCNIEIINSALEKTVDPSNVAGVLKIYFRVLSEPLIPFSQYPVFIQIVKTSTPQTRLTILKNFIRALPLLNRNCFYVLFHFLYEITISPITQMNAKNLAICFAPNIVRSPPNTEDPMISMTSMPTLIEGICFLIENINLILPKPAPKVQMQYAPSQTKEELTEPIKINEVTSTNETTIPDPDEIDRFDSVIIRGDLKNALLTYEGEDTKLSEEDAKLKEEEEKLKEQKDNVIEALTEAIQARLIDPLKETLEDAKKIGIDQNLILIAQSLLIHLENEAEVAKQKEEEAARRLEEEQELTKIRQQEEEERIQMQKELEESHLKLKELEELNKLKDDHRVAEESRRQVEADLLAQETAALDIQRKLTAQAEARKELEAQLLAEEAATQNLLEKLKAREERRKRMEAEAIQRQIEEEKAVEEERQHRLEIEKQKLREEEERQRKLVEEEKEAERQRMEEERKKGVEEEAKQKIEDERKALDQERKKLEDEKKKLDQERKLIEAKQKEADDARRKLEIETKRQLEMKRKLSEEKKPLINKSPKKPAGVHQQTGSLGEKKLVEPTPPPRHHASVSQPKNLSAVAGNKPLESKASKPNITPPKQPQQPSSLKSGPNVQRALSVSQPPLSHSKAPSIGSISKSKESTPLSPPSSEKKVAVGNKPAPVTSSLAKRLAMFEKK